MRILLAGGSGFLGRRLQAALRADGHDVGVLTRTPRAEGDVAWAPDGTTGPWARALEGAGALVNLAGEGIADKRWTPARKQAIRDSRLAPTESLVAALRTLAAPPAVLVSSSAVGYYGACGDEIVTEHTPPGSDPLAQLCVDWERAAEAASALTRVCVIRTGLVLHPEGGALETMLVPFRLGVGGRLGSGRQYMPWIHLDDWIRMTAWLIATPGAAGAFNATAPAPVTNATFTRTLARVLRRPAIFPVPGVALRLVLGEFATFVLTGQRAVPEHAERLGFTFRFTELDPALRDLLG
ncbi:MAG: TIGR01777 family oxidoreductase [Acidobacteriota bacterium]